MRINRHRVLRLWLVLVGVLAFADQADALVPVVIGPLQAFLALLPAILGGLGAAIITLFKPATVKKLILFLWHQKVFTVILILLVSGLVYGARNDWWRGTGPVAEAEVGTDWPAFRGGPLRHGVVPGAPEPDQAGSIWQYTHRAMFLSTPTVVGNRVYVTYADWRPFVDRGAVLCLDADTGNEVWRYRGEGSGQQMRATFSSPSVADGYIVVGEGLHFTDDSRVFCLDMDGNLQWVYRTDSHVETTAAIYDGKVYIGAGSDGYYCFKLEPDEKGQPQKVWRLPAEDGFVDCETSPIVHDGVVYLGVGIGGNAAVAVDAETGETIWWHDTPYPVFTAPSIDNGKLFVGMGYGDFVNSAEAAKADLANRMRGRGESEERIEEITGPFRAGGEVWCIDIETGDILWKYGDKEEDMLERVVLGAVVPKDGRIYFGSRDGRVYSLSQEDGELLAYWDARSPVTSSMAVGDQYVYFVCQRGVLYCADARTLEPVWETSLGGGEIFSSSPTIARGHVYVGTQNDGLRCIGRVGDPPPVLWNRGERGGPADPSPLSERGRVNWRLPDSLDAAQEMNLTATAPPMSLGDAVYLACKRHGEPEFIKLRAQYLTGEDAPSDRDYPTDADRVEWSVPLDSPVTEPPVGLGDTIYLVTDTDIRALAAEDGAETWRLNLEPGASAKLTLDRERLIVWTGPESVTALSIKSPSRPEVLWTREVGKGSVAPELAGELCIVSADGTVQVLCADYGTKLWLNPPNPPGSLRFAPLRVHRAVIAVTDDRLVAYNLLNGSVLWENTLSAPATQRPVAVGDTAVLATESNIAAYRVTDGEAVWRTDDLSDRNLAQALRRTGVLSRSQIEEMAGRAEEDPDRTLRELLFDEGLIADEHLNRLALGGCRAPLVLGENGDVLVGIAETNPDERAGVVFALNARTGAVLTVTDDMRGRPVADSTVAPLFASERILFVGSRGSAARGDLMILPSLDVTSANRWATTGYLGEVTTPMILLDSKVYFCTDRRGVICAEMRDAN